MENKFRVMVIAGLLLILMGAVGASSALNCQTNAGSNFRILSVQWGNSTHPVSAGPGQNDVQLTVTMQPYGTDTCILEGVKGVLQLYGGITNFNGTSTSTYNIESVNPYQLFTMGFNLNIPSNLSAGQSVLLSYPLYVSWNYSNESIRNQQAYNVSIPLRGSANLQLSAKDPSLPVGGVDNITLVITNKGTGAVAGFTPYVSASGISVISQPSVIGSIGPGQTKTTSFYAYVPASIAGSVVNLEADSYYINPYGYNTSMSSTVGMYALQSAVSQVQLSTSTQTLVSGEVQNISIIVANNETVPITNVSLSLSPQSPLSIIGAGDVINIPYIGAKASASVPVEFYATSSSAPVSTLSVQLNFNINNAAETSSRSITFLTPGYIDMSVVSTAVLPAAPAPGEIFSVTSTLENTGSQTAYAATVTPVVPAGLKNIGQNTTFIGDVATQTPTAFTMSFTSLPTSKPGKYEIPVVISYLNNLNQPSNTTLYYYVSLGAANGNYIVTGQSGPQAGSARNFTQAQGQQGARIPIIWVILVLAIIVIAVWYALRVRKRHSHGGTATIRQQLGGIISRKGQQHDLARKEKKVGGR